MAHDSHGTDQVTWDSDLSEPRNFDDRALATHMMPHTPARLHAACSMHISSKRSSNLRPAAMQLKIATCNMATNTAHDMPHASYTLQHATDAAASAARGAAQQWTRAGWCLVALEFSAACRPATRRRIRW